MAFLNLQGYVTFAGITSTDATRDASLSMVLLEVEDAIKKRLRQPITLATYTEYYDAPVGPLLQLRWLPVASVTSVHYRPGANGDSSLFTSDYALTQYEQWVLETDQPDGTSRSGLIRRTNAAGWGASLRRPYNHLAFGIEPGRREVKVVYSAGYSSVPPSLAAAGYLMASKLYASRKLGAQVQSGSDNGASYSLAGSATAEGILGDPTIAALLRPFEIPTVGVA